MPGRSGQQWWNAARSMFNSRVPQWAVGNRRHGSSLKGTGHKGRGFSPGTPVPPGHRVLKGRWQLPRTGKSSAKCGNNHKSGNHDQHRNRICIVDDALAAIEESPFFIIWKLNPMKGQPAEQRSDDT
jgi:hypothetical protein